jgi:hypothetical protein
MELKDIKFEDTAFFEESYLARVFPFPQYSNLRFDLVADDASVTGTDVDSIDSRVGSVTVTSVAKPTFEADSLNGRAAIDCDGTQSMDFGSAITEAGAFTRITVCSLATLAANVFYVGNAAENILEGGAVGQYGIRILNGGASDTSLAWPVAVDTPVIVVLTRDASDKIDVYFNQGTANRLFSDTAQSGNHTISEFTNRASFRWNGKIYRMLQWSVELTAQERFEAVKTLQEYYGLS